MKTGCAGKSSTYSRPVSGAMTGSVSGAAVADAVGLGVGIGGGAEQPPVRSATAVATARKGVMRFMGCGLSLLDEVGAEHDIHTRTTVQLRLLDELDSQRVRNTLREQLVSWISVDDDALLDSCF
ncbi:unannotated protein [freshwater metagenome]|uniref:Unannotated protein n=1 Tax=freshwater metagenome TaxID=449393 RepID=A0A6J6F7B6_9ZZZZ